MSETETAHKAWDETWKSADGRAIWLDPEDEVRELAATLLDSGAETALDLGCGVGRHAAFLASKGFKTWALDGSEAGIEHARSISGAPPASNAGSVKAFCRSTTRTAGLAPNPTLC